MKKIINAIFILLLISGLSTSIVHAQMDGLRGTDDEFRMGVHSGNQFRTSFFNDGTYGGQVGQPPQVAGEWPINSGHYYLIDGNIFVGSEVRDNQGNLIHILSENKSVSIGGSKGDTDPVSGEWWTFLPLPGFANPDEDKIAMAKGASEWENSWPAYWPDKFEDPTDPGWRNDVIDNSSDKAAWNGYFGKNVFNADEESYFVADDYMNREFDFNPDKNDLERKGLGLRIYVRGFQWAKSAVEDALFCLYDIENIGTYKHDKMIFAYKIGNNMGHSNSGADDGDDNAEINRELNLAYMTDNDDIGSGGWSPVGFFGGAFLESPGNAYDGIDNDNDGATPIPGKPGSGSGHEITEALWITKTLGLNDPIVLINYETYARKVTTLGDTLALLGTDTLEVLYNERIFKFYDGKELTEIGDNLVDDNLNGLIDENRGAIDAFGVFQYLYILNGVGYKYVDYFDPDPATSGIMNPMLDERRDDGDDNDGDWDPLTDDTGTDGLIPGNPGWPGADFGENDGFPTRGEPHFDKTDIDETDMLGLTNCNLYEWPSVSQYDDENYWQLMVPGVFAIPVVAQNVELLFGSGYFPLIPGQTERISMGIICGSTRDDLFRTKGYVADAYNQNYNFSKAPYIPTVHAVAGNNRVILLWDNYAEQSEDPISGKDFEGYRIYRSTDPGFNDMAPITDGYGSSVITPLFRQPIAQFDIKDNGYDGFAAIPTQGVHFDLGRNTGLFHHWIDTTAINGFKYFYAVTSYDHGDPELGIDPSECTKFVAMQASGEIEKGTNVVIAKPEAPAAGYVPANFENETIMAGPENTATGTIDLNILNPDSIKDKHTYEITFTDTLSSNLSDSTAAFTLVDMTDRKTLLKNYPMGDGEVPIIDGFQLAFLNNPVELGFNADSSHWNRTGIPAFNVEVFQYLKKPVQLIAGDFEIHFSDEAGLDTSKYYERASFSKLQAIPVNFTVINTSTNQKVDFAFNELIKDRGQGLFDYAPTRSDEIILLADAEQQIASWKITFSVTSASESDTLFPGAGDVLTLRLDKPFLQHDSFQFTTISATIDHELAAESLNDIRVVPNPYIATNSWEPRNPYANGRGERALHFTHLPSKCTIEIFNVRGQLVQTLEHDSPINDGTKVWDMLSKDNLEIAYGIYVYHVEAEGVGEKIGKFVVIK